MKPGVILVSTIVHKKNLVWKKQVSLPKGNQVQKCFETTKFSYPHANVESTQACRLKKTAPQH